jgi:predicted dehydrogenase
MAKVAILTTAHIHTPNFVRRLAGRMVVQVAGVWDRDRGLAEKFAKELGVGVLASAEAALSDKSVEGVIITGATSQHDGLAAAAARAGKHVFIEKPLATTGTEAVKIFNAVKESGVIFQTGHFMRSHPVNRFIRQEIEAGSFGTITRARHSNCHHGALGGWFDKDYRWFFQKDQAGGGGFYDMGCHSVDILVYFFGPIHAATANIGAKSIKYAIDEYGEGMLQFRNGVVATVAGSWVDAGNPVTHLISGTEGYLAVMNGAVYYASSKTKVKGADGKTALDATQFPETLPHAFDLFLDVLTGARGKEVLIPVEDALNVARAMEAMYLGDRTGGWVKV